MHEYYDDGIGDKHLTSLMAKYGLLQGRIVPS
jgi:hypothetical protein